MLLAALDMTQHKYPPYAMTTQRTEEFWFVIAVIAFGVIYGWYRFEKRCAGTWRE